MKVRIHSHNPRSNGAFELVNTLREVYDADIRDDVPRLDIRKIATNSTYRYKKGDTVINWGSSSRLPHMADEDQASYINHPMDINLVSNKISFFMAARSRGMNYLMVPHTTDRSVAIQWLQAGARIVERHKIRGHSGEGIRIKYPNTDDVISSAPLYTRYINKSNEYRIHLIRKPSISSEDGVQTRGGVHNDFNFFTQQKKRRLDVPDQDVDWKVRNFENGFIYSPATSANIEGPLYSELAALMNIFQLDFGAFDVIQANSSQYNIDIGATPGRYYVLECNTAPGLSSVSGKRFYATHLLDLLYQRAYDQQQAGE